MFGWIGKILSIDISTEKYEIIKPDFDVYRKFIGGKGLSGYFLKPWIKEEWNSQRMPILFFTGPLVGTPSPTSGRMTIMSRSPLTGTIGDTSVGGKLGTEIKRSGWDGIIIYGKAKSLIGINIINSNISFIDASDFKGLEIGRSMDLLKKKFKVGSKAVIGPAAENGVFFASIAVDGHYFSGRNGLGLVMADKGIKFINVHGTGKIECHDIKKVNLAREEILRLVSASPALMGEMGISNFGTGAIYDLTDSRNMMPTDNFRKSNFPDAKNMNAWRYKNKYNPKKTGCTGCHILCKKIGENNIVIPEFETMSHFSALLGNSDINTVVEANTLCNSLGMDTISAAVTLSCYSDIINKKLNSKDILKLLEDIGYSRGEGCELKKGSYVYARLKGRPESAVTVKKLELSAYDPRGAYGMALAFATSTRGGCHLRAYPISHEILRKPVSTDRFTFSGKARIIKINEDMNAVIDSLTACKFIFFGASLEEYALAYTGVTSESTSPQDLLKAGERIYYNERIMNFLNGFTDADDDLPDTFFNRPGSNSNGTPVVPLNRAEFLDARKNYYVIRGLDEKGNPKREKCRELGLEWIN